jgi:hypothetical protein
MHNVYTPLFVELVEHTCSDRSWRIDVVAVQFSRSGKLEEIRIYQHAVTDIE